MSVIRGIDAFKAMKQTFDRQGGGQGFRFVLKDGESAVIRIYGDFEGNQAPEIGTIHYIKKLPPGQQYQNCGENTDTSCVFCSECSRGNKDLKQSKRAYLFVKDFRKFHSLEQETRVLRPGVELRPGRAPKADDFIMTKYPPCRAPNRVCEFCRAGSEAKVTGLRRWELSTMHAEQLIGLQASLRNYCRCGAMDEEGGGTLQITQYLCSGCNTPVEFFPERGIPLANCSHCRKSLPPLEEVTCTACDNPTRCDIQDFMFRVKRTGASQDTSYNFEPIMPPKPPSEEELEEAEKNKPDWEKILAPEPPEKQAALLGIPSPFQTAGHGAAAYAAPMAAKPSASPAAPKAGRVDLGKTLRKLGSSKPTPKPTPPAAGVKKPTFKFSKPKPSDDDGTYLGE